MKTDLKYAFRTLHRSPGFACAAIVTLALGIAANGTVFTLLNGVLLRDLPFDQPDRIVALRVADVGGPQPIVTGLSYLELRDWQERARTFDGIGGFNERTMNVSDEEHAAERFSGAHLSSMRLHCSASRRCWVAPCNQGMNVKAQRRLSCWDGLSGRHGIAPVLTSSVGRRALAVDPARTLKEG